MTVEFLSRMVEVSLIWNERIFLDLLPYFGHFYFNIFPDNCNRIFFAEDTSLLYLCNPRLLNLDINRQVYRKSCIKQNEITLDVLFLHF